MKRSCSNGTWLPGPVIELTLTPWPQVVEVFCAFGQKLKVGLVEMKHYQIISEQVLSWKSKVS